MEGVGQASAEPVGSLTCTFLDRRSSVPLAGARLSCVWRDDRVTRLDADSAGRCTCELPEGVYDLVISAHGFLSLFVRGVGVLAGRGQTLTRGLVPGQGHDPDGAPSTAVGGYVRDRRGRPAFDANVHLAADGGAYIASCDRDGAYMIHGVPAGTYAVTVRSAERVLAREELAIERVREFVRRDYRIPRV